MLVLGGALIVFRENAVRSIAKQREFLGWRERNRRADMTITVLVGLFWIALSLLVLTRVVLPPN
jgi:hypothetical protein